MNHNFDFDNHFRSIQKRQTSIFRVAFIGWIISAIFGLGLLGAIIYVAAHFLAKVW